MKILSPHRDILPGLWVGLLLIGTTIPPVLAIEFEKAQAIYSNRVAEMDAELDTVRKQATIQYLQGLRQFEQEAIRAGNLTAVQNTRDLIQQFDQDPAIPTPDTVSSTLTRLQARVLSMVRKAEQARDRELYQLTLQYTRALEARKKELVRAGKLNDAIQVDKALKETTARLNQLRGVQASGRGKVVDGNVARKATASGVKKADELFDGNSGRYDGSSRFAYWIVGHAGTIDLGELYSLAAIRFLLWNKEPGRYYRYALDVSTDQKTWKNIRTVDKGEKATGWQRLDLLGRPVRYIRIQALENNKNNQFHVVEFEAWCRAPK